MTIHDRDLELAARRLGERAAARLDVRRTSDAVIERLRATRHPWWAAPGVLRVAAGVVLALGLGLFLRSGTRNGSELAFVPVAELQPLSEAELTEVMDSLVVQGPAPALTGVVLSDLNERELAQLLASMEG